MTGETATGTLVIALYVVPGSSLPLTAAQSTTIAELVAAAGVDGGGAQLIATGVTATVDAGVTAGTYVLDAWVALDSQFNLTGHFISNGFGDISADASIADITALTGEADLNFVLGAVLATETTGVILTVDEFSLNFV